MTCMKNPRALKAGYMVSDSAVDYAMAGTNPMEVQNRLLRGIAGKRLYNLKTVSSETTLTGMAAFNIRLKKDEHGYLYIPGTEPDTVTINGQEQKSDYWNNNFLDLGTYDTETNGSYHCKFRYTRSCSRNLSGNGSG